MESKLTSSSPKTLVLITHPKTYNFPPKPSLTTAAAVFFTLLCLTPAAHSAFSNSDFESSYDLHCSAAVPRSPSAASDGLDPPSATPIVLNVGHFRGGAPILNQTLSSGGKSISFRPYTIHRTVTDGLYALRATLYLRASAIAGNSDAPPISSQSVRFPGPRVGTRRWQYSFQLQGFWSESSHEVCMIGSGIPGVSKTVALSVVLKLHFPHNSTIYASVVSGSLESLDSSNNSESYFSPISLLAVPQRPSHDYTLVEKDNSCLSRDDGGEESARVSALHDNGCRILKRVERFDLTYDGGCDGSDCNPLDEVLGFMPSYMFLSRTQCGTKDKKWKMLLDFSNSSYSRYRFPFDLKTTLVAEGAWNEKEDRFCGVGCRILNFAESFDNAYIGDCSTGFSLRFPASLSVRNRGNIVGKIWRNNKAVNGSGHSGEIGISDFSKILMDSLGAKYEYTVIGSLRKTCTMSNTSRGKGKKYPNEYSRDMVFDMSVKDSKGLSAMGYSKPFIVGSQLDRNQYFGLPRFNPQETQTEFSVMSNNTHNSLVNISYEISFNVPTDFKFNIGNSSYHEVKISAEGTYNKDNGVLCLIGCRNLGSETLNSVTNNTFDCEISINVQFSPLDSKTNKDVKGTIESMRERTDPLFFEHLELSSNSIYIGQAEESIWRMDLEITMVIISKTLTCVFVGLQLFYIKSRPEVLPLASVMMLVVLTMGLMIPLVLNFEALFVSYHIPQNNFLGSGGWLEANEVIVRIVTMVAFLLQLRLLQLTWSSRKDEANEKNLWKCERRVLYLTVPLYILGVLIAWFVNHLKNSTGIRIRALRNPQFQHHSLPQISLWKDLKSYAGLVMDGFLLPQILFNLFMDSGEKALTPLFYAGITLVRLLPHAYDLYRAHAYTSYLDLSYIYASHIMDFYSTAWDIIIPLGGLLLVALIFLQQRFGGRCILPGKFRQRYEKVPVISNDDL